MIRFTLLKFTAAILLISGSAVSLSAGNILSITGQSACSFCPAVDDNEFIAISFETTQSYSNVSFTPELVDSFTSDPPITGTAYLMTQIGPGTTTADQIASGNFTFPYSTNGIFQPIGVYQTVLQGIDIGPGTYYFLLTGPNATSATGFGNWSAAYIFNASVAADLGVTTPMTFYSSSTTAAYSPAENFGAINGNPQQLLEFTITGDPAPEPASWALLAIGLYWIQRHRARHASSNERN